MDCVGCPPQYRCLSNNSSVPNASVTRPQYQSLSYDAPLLASICRHHIVAANVALKRGKFYRGLALSVDGDRLSSDTLPLEVLLQVRWCVPSEPAASSRSQYDGDGVRNTRSDLRGTRTTPGFAFCLFNTRQALVYYTG